MANTTIPQLPAVAAVTGAEQIAAVQNGITVRLTVQQISSTASNVANLPSASALTGTEQIAGLQNSSSVSITSKQIADFSVKNVSSLSAASTLTGTEQISILQSGNPVSTTTQNIANIPNAVTPFSLTIPLGSGSKYMPPVAVTAASGVAAAAFTLGSSPTAGTQCTVKLCANGVSSPPTFTGFVEWGASIGWTNTQGAINTISFWYDGTYAYYAITPNSGSPTTLPVPLSGAKSTVGSNGNILITMSASVAGLQPNASKFTVVTTNSGSPVTDNIVSVSTAGSAITIVTSRVATSGDTTVVSYSASSGSGNNLVDATTNKVYDFSISAISYTQLLDLLSALGTPSPIAYSLRKISGTATSPGMAFAEGATGATAINFATAVSLGFDSNGDVTFPAALGSGGTRKLYKFTNQGTAGSAYDIISDYTFTSPKITFDSTLSKYVADTSGGSADAQMYTASNATQYTTLYSADSGGNRTQGSWHGVVYPDTTTQNSQLITDTDNLAQIFMGTGGGGTTVNVVGNFNLSSVSPVETFPVANAHWMRVATGRYLGNQYNRFPGTTGTTMRDTINSPAASTATGATSSDVKLGLFQKVTGSGSSSYWRGKAAEIIILANPAIGGANASSRSLIESNQLAYWNSVGTANF